MTKTNGEPSIGLKRSHLTGISFTAGLVLGVLAVITIQFFKPQAEQPSLDIARSQVRQTSTKSSDRPTTEQTVEVGQFHEIFKHHRIAVQQKTLHSTLSRATEQELIEWWKQSQKIERENHRNIAQSAILQNLTTVNPQEALRRIDDVSKFQTETLLKNVFSQWSVSQLDGAIEAATELSTPRRKVALQAILETRDDLTESELHSIATRLQGEETFLKLVSDSKASLSIVEPKQSWNILVSDDVDDSLQEESLAIVAQEWYEQIGFEVLSNIYDTEFENRRSKNQWILAIAQMDLVGALDYTRGLLEEDEKEYLSKRIVGAWARTDAQAALAAISSFESTSLVADLEWQIGVSWAQSNPNDMIRNFDTLSKETRQVPVQVALMRIARSDPLKAIAKLNAIESQIEDTSMIEKMIVQVWSREEPDAAAAWVVDSFALDDPQRFRLLRDVLPKLTREDPNKAFELAIAEPTPNRGVGLAVSVLNALTLEGDIELALQLLPRVKEDRVWAFASIGEAMVRESRRDEALKLGKDFAGRDQWRYYNEIFGEWVDTDPQDLYESLEKLLSNSIKSRAASRLIARNRNNPVFTDDQIERIKTFLNSEDEARLKR